MTHGRNTTRHETWRILVERRKLTKPSGSRRKTRGSKEIPVYFHKVRLPSRRGWKSRGVKVNKTSRIEISLPTTTNACFRSPCKYPKAGQWKSRRKPMSTRVVPALEDLLSFVERPLISVEEVTFCRRLRFNCQNDRNAARYMSVQLFFVSFSPRFFGRKDEDKERWKLTASTTSLSFV